MRFLNRAGKSRQPFVAHATAGALWLAPGWIGRYSRSVSVQQSQTSACKVQASRPTLSGLFPVARFIPPAAEVA